MNVDAPDKLPNSLEAEDSLLGAVMFDNSLVDEAIALVRPEDFYTPSRRVVFEAMISLAAKGSKIDITTLKVELESTKNLERAGGVTALAGLYGLYVAVVSVKDYANIVRSKALYRKIYKQALSIARNALDESDEAGALVEAATTAMMQIERYGSVESDFRSFSEIAVDASELYEQMYKGESRAMPTGYASLDQATRGGIYPGEVRVIMATTGSGKTAWALGAAKHQASMGIPVAFVSLEMSDIENFFRIHSAMSGVAAWKIKGGIWPHDYQTLQETIRLPGDLPIWMASSSRMANVYEMRRQVKEIVIKHKIRMLYVDYLQLAEAMMEKGTRALEISTVTRILKLMAREFQMGVCELSQPSQEGAKSGKVRTIHNRESTAIGNDADIVIAIDMPEDRENLDEWECTQRIDKHRNGPKMALKYWYHGPTMTFSEDRPSASPLIHPPSQNNFREDWNA